MSLTEPVADDFNAGDWYTIDVERDGVAKQFEGEFIKSNDQWIILRRISEGRNDVDVPVLAKIPVLGPRVFRRVEVGRLTRFLWIPRDAATITARVRVANPRPPADISDEAPSLHAHCRVVAADDDKVVELSGNLTDASDEAFVLTGQRNFYTKRAVPLLGELPVVGGAFSNVVAEIEQFRDEIPRETILCVYVDEQSREKVVIEDAPATEKTPVSTATNPSSRRQSVQR